MRCILSSLAFLLVISALLATPHASEELPVEASTQPSSASLFQGTVQAAAGKHSALMVTLANQHALVGYLPSLLTSLSLSMKSTETASALLIVVETEEEMELCRVLHSPCWLDDFSVVPDVPVPEEANLPGWQPRSTARLSWRRVDYVHSILAMGVGVFILDLDLLFYGDPFSLLSDPKYSGLDFFSQSESGDSQGDVSTGNINMGFSYFAPTDNARELVSKWMTLRTMWDQGALHSLLEGKAVPGLKWATLPSDVAYSLCHPRLGSGNDATDETEQQSHPLFHLRYYEHLVHYVEHYKALITFHFPCCNHPSRRICKSFLMSLALHARSE